MIARLVPAAALLVAAFAAAGCASRKPPETVPDATLPDGTPLIRRDSTAPRPQEVEPAPQRVPQRVERAGGEEPPVYIALNLDVHNVALQAKEGIFALDDRSVAMTSLEGQFQPLRGFGVGAAARAIVGPFDSPRYSEAALLVGWRWLAADLGFANRRTANILSGKTYDSTFTVFRPGIRSRVNIGETGLSAHGRAGRYIELPEGGSGPKARVRGWNLEAGASYTIRWRYPLTASVGMRREFIQVWDRRQRANSVSLGLGLLIGRQPEPLVKAEAPER